MNFFNIGTAELLQIFAIALIVVGPRRLPQIARDFGKILSDVRQMSQEFTAPIMQEMNAPAKENETKEIATQNVHEKAASGYQGEWLKSRKTCRWNSHLWPQSATSC